MASVVVRIPADAYAKLRGIADARHETVGQIISEMVDEIEEQQFWRRTHESVERLRADPVAWKEYRDEVAVFEGGAWDGLEDEEPYYSPQEEEAIRAEHARTQSR